MMMKTRGLRAVLLDADSPSEWQQHQRKKARSNIEGPQQPGTLLLLSRTRKYLLSKARGGSSIRVEMRMAAAGSRGSRIGGFPLTRPIPRTSGNDRSLKVSCMSSFTSSANLPLCMTSLRSWHASKLRPGETKNWILALSTTEKPVCQRVSS